MGGTVPEGRGSDLRNTRPGVRWGHRATGLGTLECKKKKKKRRKNIKSILKITRFKLKISVIEICQAPTLDQSLEQA